MIITTNNPLPTHCEFCHSELTWDGPNLICSNSNCGHMATEYIKAWCMNVAPIDGLGWATIQKCLDISPWIPFSVNTVEDLYKVARNPLARNHHVKANSEADLFNKMLDKLTGPITISQFLLALKIPGLGKIGAKKVEDAENAMIAFQSILCFKGDDFCGKDNVWAKLLQDVNVASSLYNEYRDYFVSCYNLVKDQIIFDGVNDDISKIETKGSVVITGTLSVKRDTFIKMLEENGWKVASKINSNTAYLLSLIHI